MDLGRSAPPSVHAEWLTRSLLAPDGEDQIALRQGSRYALRLMPPVPTSNPVGSAGEEDAAYLITGGLGGVGQHIAKVMATAGARRLILLGRASLPPREEWSSIAPNSDFGRRIAAVRALEAMGTAVHTPSVDVSDEVAVFHRYAVKARPRSVASYTPPAPLTTSSPA